MSASERSLSHSKASPSCWVERQPAERATNRRFLKVSGLRVKYIGPGTEDKDAASVRADHCVPFGCGLYYFEIEILDKGRNGFVGVGFSGADVSLDRLPGWESHSYGYHGDDGHAFHNSGRGLAYGPTFGTGDVIGVILNRCEKTIAYTKNGMHLGVAFRNVCEERLYPTVGMRTPGEEIVANFGATHFQGDLEGIKSEAEQRIQQQIAQCNLPPPQMGPRILEQLVFDYLRHQGYYCSAVRAGTDLLNNAASITANEKQEIEARQSITAAIMAGDIDAALEKLNLIAPSLLADHKHLNFALQCQKFMHMIQTKHVDEALKFGQTVVGPLVEQHQERNLLQDALTLFAHNDPTDCPNYQQLLGTEAHAQLAVKVNAAVLESQGHPKQSCLELILRQLEVVKHELLDRGDPSAALVDFNKALILKGKVA